MKLLLTSGGIRNSSIKNALISMLDKPINECIALCITTASYAQSEDGVYYAWQFLTGKSVTNMINQGWKKIGIIELTAMANLEQKYWLKYLHEADVLLVNGGDPLFLNYWFVKSGLVDILPSLEIVYVGLSAGSMIMGPTIGEGFAGWQPLTGGNKTLGLVDFSIFPHLDYPEFPENDYSHARKWAKALPNHAFAIDDNSAISVVNGNIKVISEGHWHYFEK